MDCDSGSPLYFEELFVHELLKPSTAQMLNSPGLTSLRGLWGQWPAVLLLHVLQLFLDLSQVCLSQGAKG